MRRSRMLSLDDAAAALDAAEATLTQWSGEAADKAHAAEVLAAELAEAQARAGDDLLDAEDAEEDQAAVTQIAERLLRLQTEQRLAVQAAERAAERLAVVRREVLLARAGSLRPRAAQLREAAATRQARTDQLLAELADFERVPFGPVATHSALGVAGAPMTPNTLTQQVLRRAQWLEDHAGWLEITAAQGAQDQVLAAVNQPVPERVEVESAVFAGPVVAAG